MEILDVVDTLTFQKVFWKAKTFWRKLESCFLAETAKTGNAIFPCKTALSQEPMLRQIEWGVQDGPPFVSIYFTFFKILFSIRTFFLLFAFFFTNISNHRTAVKGEGISLTPHYHFHPFHRHLDVSRAITTEISPLHIASSRTRTKNLWFLRTSR